MSAQNSLPMLGSFPVASKISCTGSKSSLLGGGGLVEGGLAARASARALPLARLSSCSSLSRWRLAS